MTRRTLFGLALGAVAAPFAPQAAASHPRIRWYARGGIAELTNVERLVDYQDMMTNQSFKCEYHAGEPNRRATGEEWWR